MMWPGKDVVSQLAYWETCSLLFGLVVNLSILVAYHSARLGVPLSCGFLLLGVASSYAAALSLCHQKKCELENLTS